MSEQSPAVLDEAALERLRSFGGERRLSGMIELFLATDAATPADASEALDCGGSAALRAALHGLKSSAGQLGALSVHQACVAGEELASRGDLSACTTHVQRIETDLPLALRQLKAIRVSTPT